MYTYNTGTAVARARALPSAMKECVGLRMDSKNRLRARPLSVTTTYNTAVSLLLMQIVPAELDLEQSFAWGHIGAHFDDGMGAQLYQECQWSIAPWDVRLPLLFGYCLHVFSTMYMDQRVEDGTKATPSSGNSYVRSACALSSRNSCAPPPPLHSTRLLPCEVSRLFSPLACGPRHPELSRSAGRHGQLNSVMPYFTSRMCMMWCVHRTCSGRRRGKSSYHCPSSRQW